MQEEETRRMDSHKRKNNMFASSCMNNNHHQPHEESEQQHPPEEKTTRIGSDDHESVAIVNQGSAATVLRKVTPPSPSSPSSAGSSINLLTIPAPASSSSSLSSYEQQQQCEINRRSRSNSIAAGAIARLKNLPQIRLSLPPEDLILYQSNPSSSSSCLMHESLPESPPGKENMSESNNNINSSSSGGGDKKLFDHLPIAHPLHPVNRVHSSSGTFQNNNSNNISLSPTLAGSTLHQRRGLGVRKQTRLKVLDQKDLNLKPERDVRRNSLPINDQLQLLSPSSNSIQIRFLSETAGRRLSQVSSVVSAQIQSTIGWRSLISEEEVIDQAKCLAAKFVWIKLRKSGFCHKRFHLQRLRSVCNFGDNEEIDRMLNQVTSELRALGNHLESAHPKIFTSVLNQVGPNCFKSVTTVVKTQILVGQFLFSCQEITWTHVAAFFTITAALALDSVISGHHDFVMPLIDSFADFANGDLSQWIVQEGGWETIVNKYREEDEWMRKFRWIIFILVLTFILIALIFIF